MPSTNVSLPSFTELCRSLLNIGPQGYQIIKGPLTLDQYWWLFHNGSQGVANENSPWGNNYTVDKPSAAIATEPDLCLGPSGGFARDLYHSKSLTFTDPRLAQGKSFCIYLHPIIGDQCSVIPVASTISFTSTDPTDRPLDLPGVSISRLLAKEPGTLVNANNYFPSSAFGIVFDTITVDITVVGHEKRAHTALIPLECSHAYITHLGLAQAIANGFHNVLSQSPQPRPVHEKTLRLVAIYSTDPSGQRWNAAYAIVKMKGSK